MIKLCCEYLSPRCIRLNVIIMSRTSFRVYPHSIVWLNVKDFLATSRCYIWSLSNSNEIRTHSHLVRKRTINHLVKLAKWLSCVVSTYLYGVFIIISCRVLEWTHPPSIVSLNTKELLLPSRCHIWSLSDISKIRTHNLLVCKRTLNHLAQLAKWLSCVVSTYLYSAFNCTLLSCHVRVSEWTQTL